MKRKTTGNSTFTIVSASSSFDSFVVKESSVLHINTCAEKSNHRKSAEC